MVLIRGWDARSLLALGASTGAGVCRILVDHVPDGLEFGLNECDDGGLSRKDALVELMFVLLEEWL